MAGLPIMPAMGRITAVRGVSVYIGRQILLLLTVITVGLTFVIWLTQTVRFLDLIINRGLPLTTALHLLGLLVPQLLIMILPAALFISTLFVYWRLGADSELVVLRGAGMSPWQMARPALATALAVTLLSYWLCLSLAPHANRSFAALSSALREDFSRVLLQAGVFTEATPGVTVYARAPPTARLPASWSMISVLAGPRRSIRPHADFFPAAQADRRSCSRTEPCSSASRPTARPRSCRSSAPSCNWMGKPAPAEQRRSRARNG
jgi:hypothetical protein